MSAVLLHISFELKAPEKNAEICRSCFDYSADGILVNIAAFVRSDALLVLCEKHRPERQKRDAFLTKAKGEELYMECGFCRELELSPLRATAVSFHFDSVETRFCIARETGCDHQGCKLWLPFICALCFFRLFHFLIELQRKPRRRELNVTFFPKEITRLIGNYAFQFTASCPKCNEL